MDINTSEYNDSEESENESGIDQYEDDGFLVDDNNEEEASEYELVIKLFLTLPL